MGGTILGNHKLPTQEFFTGETPLIKMYEKDGDTNQPLDLTNATSTLRLCYFEDKSFVVMTKVGTIKQPTLGYVEFQMYEDDTSNLEEGSYLIQRELVLQDGTVSIVEGEWFLRKGV